MRVRMHAMDRMDVKAILQRYLDGYFPMYDLPPDQGGTGEFFWDRWPVRAVLPVNAETLARARHLARSAQKRAVALEIRHSTAVDAVIAQLQTVRDNTWVQPRVVEIYRTLHAAGLLQTVEAWTTDAATGKHAGPPRGGQLVGALLGLVLPGTFVAETMYGIVPEASKLCLCRLVEDCAADGFTMIDVQTPHDRDGAGDLQPATRTAHPCIRLGEVYTPLPQFLRELTAAWTRSFDGDLDAWLALAAAPRDPQNPPLAGPRRFLRHTARE